MTNRLYGAVQFRYDPASEAAIFTVIGADGSEPISSTNGLPTETMHHLRIVSGNVFVHNNEHIGVAASASYWHVLTTGANDCRLVAYHSTSDSAPVWIAVSESPTFSGGASASFVNRNRRSLITPLATLVEGATVTASGTHMEGDYAAGTKQTGGSAEIAEEWLLKASTSYGFLIRNDSTGLADISFHLEIVEI